MMAVQVGTPNDIALLQLAPFFTVRDPAILLLGRSTTYIETNSARDTTTAK